MLIPKSQPTLPQRTVDRFSLIGKVAVVTGASGPIGQVVSQAFAEAGATVIMLYSRDESAVQKARSLSDETGQKVVADKLDVRDFDATKIMIAKIVKEHGHLDIWAANAGIPQDIASLIDGDPKDWLNQININYVSLVYQASLLGKVWKTQGSGNMIITGSGAAVSNIRPVDQAIYNSSKAAAVALARSLAQEFKDFARVNAVSPGYLGTGQGCPEDEMQNALSRQVLGRTGSYEEIQGVFLYLASEASTFCTGSNIIVDGGYTL